MVLKVYDSLQETFVVNDAVVVECTIYRLHNNGVAFYHVLLQVMAYILVNWDADDSESVISSKSKGVIN